MKNKDANDSIGVFQGFTGISGVCGHPVSGCGWVLVFTITLLLAFTYPREHLSLFPGCNFRKIAGFYGQACNICSNTNIYLETTGLTYC